MKRLFLQLPTYAIFFSAPSTQAQAARESEVKFSVRARESELLQLHTHLRTMEKEAAVSAETTATLKLEVDKLRRISKRDGVNMEYLKNIVVQYLSLRDDTKKRTLARVLETLLQVRISIQLAFLLISFLSPGI